MADSGLSIVVLNYNTRDLLARCLQSIQRYAPDAETIVIDNASPDGSARVVQQQFPWARLQANAANVGFARGMNEGLAFAAAPLVLALNADTELLPDTLPPLLETTTRLPRAGILGPAQYAPDPARPGATGRQLASAFPDPTLLREAWRLLLFGDNLLARLRLGPWQPYTGPPRPVAWLMGAALLLRRTCLNDIHAFDETQFMYGEDWDLCYRARAAGWQVYFVPSAHILHHENAAGQQQFGAARRARVVQANLHFHQKHFGKVSRRMLAGLYGLGAGLRLGVLLLHRPLQRASPLWSEKWHGHLMEARAALSDLLTPGG